MSPNNTEKTVGAVLKDARQAKNISLEEVSKHTHIHPNIVRSMENDDFKSLGTVYAKSFLKLYAEYLGLDKEATLRRFEAEAGVSAPAVPKSIKTAPGPKAIRIRRVPLAFVRRSVAALKNTPAKAVLVLFVVLAVIFSIVKFRAHIRASSRKPATSAAEVKKAPVPATAAQAKPAAKTTALRPVPVAPSVQPRQTKTEAAAKAPVPVKEQEKIVLVLRTKDKTFLQIKVDGKVVLESVLPKGSAESWQARERIEMWIGNAGAVQLELNGKLLQKIGRPGQTLRRVIVTREGLTIQK